MATMNVLGNGVYGLTEAARLTGLPRARVKQWFEVRSSESPRRRVFQSDYEATHGQLAISFLDLVELNVGGKLREHGFSLPFLRRIRSRLREEWGTKHPFCRKEFRTGGRALLAGKLDENGRGVVVDAATRRTLFDTVVMPFLKTLDYDDVTKLARRWHIAPLVVIDPAIGFGRPTVQSTRISTKVLAAGYYANGEDADVVARWYGVKQEQVLAAVSFENDHAA